MKRFLLPLLLFVFIACKKDKLPDNGGGEPNPPEETPVKLTGLVSTDKNFPSGDESFKLVFDPSKGDKGLQGFSGDIYLYAGVITDKSANEKDWKYTKSSSFNNPDAASKMTRQSNGTYNIDINPRNFFAVPANEKIVKVAIVFRNADGSITGRNADGGDIYVSIFDNTKTNIRFAAPEMQPTFSEMPVSGVVAVGQELTVTAIASKAVNLVLTLNGKQFATASNATSITGKAVFTESGQQTIAVSANGSSTASFNLGTVAAAALPQGVKLNGITFTNGGKSATFALYSPGKSYVNVVGDFNNWTPDAASFMKRTPDGNTWWTTIDNLDANKQYAYQYWVDGVLKIADPYTEKVLDPNNDQYIPAANYSNFGTYPTGKATGIVSTFKANDTKYNWQHGAFSRPAKTNLVIYELLLRDFLGSNNYKTLTDTLNYLSNLGVSAVELMPVNEFEGNSSWGYNPDFYFAPDKYYGSKQDLQQFIDACHGKGIAVILDMVLNHSFGQSPMVQLYFDATTQKPAANNPWFNVDAKHPYNVGYDFNHESGATQTFVKNVLEFWMKEYRVDGFRFDLSKGFTQTDYGTSDAAVGAWSTYDASRVAIWKTYNNFIKSVDPNNFYVILEHFAEDKEEKELSEQGMMLWNNLNYNFNEASMGWLDNSNFNRTDYKTHGFTSADGLVTYMESHDEERMMFKNLQYGNVFEGYNIKTLNTALKRQEMCAAFLFAIPGPKMLWQFGELGYDKSIDENGRTGEKPVLWEYNANPERLALKNAFARFIKLKKNNNIFTTTDFVYDFSGAVKYIRLKSGSNSVVVVGNFDVKTQSANIDFGNSGTWYDAANNNQQKILTGNTYTEILAPDEYHVFSNIVLNQ